MIEQSSRYAGSGKEPHGYTKIYNQLFGSMQHEPIHLLEIGISINRSDGPSSLQVWKDYFSKGTIVGIDIDPFCLKYKEDRINIHIGSQNDVNFLTATCHQYPKFDIIIDDGSHINLYTTQSFKTLWPHLKSGGHYIIEDLHCSYDALGDSTKSWPGMQYNPPQDIVNSRKDMDIFFNEIIYKLDHRLDNIDAITLFPTIAIITKN